jgi:hypothetical protein
MIIPKRQFICDDCFGKPTCPQLKDDVWLSIFNIKNLLCIDCAETRLGRLLKLSDLERCVGTLTIEAFVQKERRGLL